MCFMVGYIVSVTKKRLVMAIGKKFETAKKVVDTAKKRIPTLRDGFNNFMLSLIKLPFGTIIDKKIVDVENLKKVLVDKSEMSLAELIRAAINIKDDNMVEAALDALFPAELEEKAAKVFDFTLNSFK